MPNFATTPPGTVNGQPSGGASSTPASARSHGALSGLDAGGASSGQLAFAVASGGIVRVNPSIILKTHSFIPPVGTPIYPLQAITFVVESNTGDLTPFVLKVALGDRWEVAFDSVSFSKQYEGSSVKRAGSLWQLTVTRKDGWPSSPTFSPIPVANVELG